jgi:hypothetical protein
MTTKGEPLDQATEVARGVVVLPEPGQPGAVQRPPVQARPVTRLPDLKPALSLPAGFRFDEIRAVPSPVPPPTPPLGPLGAFVGNFAGSGFNTIFRPDSPQTPTPLPSPVAGSDNVLEAEPDTRDPMYDGGHEAFPP